MAPKLSPMSGAKVLRPMQAPFQTSSRIAIIGAGPAGLTMAHTLKSRGYSNVTVFEKEKQVGGMTRTVWDKGSVSDEETSDQDVRTVPHEMGTCYLATYRHRQILDLMDKVHLNRLNLAPMYVVNDTENWAPRGMQFIEWAGKILYEMDMGFPTDPRELATLIAEKLDDYLGLRKELFHNPDDSYLFPRERPSEKNLEELAMPTYDWLKKHHLLVLLPIFTQSTTSQGYGYLKEVPAYYTLMWNNDELLGYPAFEPVVKELREDRKSTKKNFPLLFAALKNLEFEAAKRNDDLPSPQQYKADNKKENKIGADYRALIVQDGFQQLWTRLAMQLNVRLGVKEMKITRTKAEPGLTHDVAPVTIEFKQADDVRQCNVFDFLMLSTKYDEVKTFLDVDLTTEGQIFKDIRNYELTTTLFSCAPEGLKKLPQAFVMDLLLESKDINRCYGTRTSIDCVRPGLAYHIQRDKRVAYQVTKPETCDEDVKAQFMTDIQKYGARDVEVDPLVEGTANPKRWKYLPHFEGPNIAHLWDLWNLQAQNNYTWYLGSLTCFESTADVYSYNLQLCDWFQAFNGPPSLKHKTTRKGEISTGAYRISPARPEDTRRLAPLTPVSPSAKGPRPARLGPLEQESPGLGSSLWQGKAPKVHAGGEMAGPNVASTTTRDTESLQTHGRRSQTGRLRDVNLLLEGLEDVREDDENVHLAKAVYIKPELTSLATTWPSSEGFTLDSLLPEGLMVNAYYPDWKDSNALEESLRIGLASFWPGPFGFKLDVVPVASNLVHLIVLRQSQRTAKELMRVLNQADKSKEGWKPVTTFEFDDDIFHFRRVAGLWALFPFPRPVINFVLFVAVKPKVASGSVKELVIVRGKHFRGDLKLKWRVCGYGEPLKKFKRMTTEALEELGIMYLTSSPESVAVEFGISATELAGQKVSIQWMRNLGEYGSPLKFDVPMLPVSYPAATSVSIVHPNAPHSSDLAAASVSTMNPDRPSQALGPPAAVASGSCAATKADITRAEQGYWTSVGPSTSAAPTDLEVAAAAAPEDLHAVSQKAAGRWRTRRWDYDVFISHAGEDKAFAYRLRDTFEKVGLKAFVDQADLTGGDKADLRMLTAVAETPVGLALMSKDFLRKEWPIKELKIIVGEGTLLPVLYNISYENAKRALVESPFADSSNPSEWQQFVDTVMRTTAVKNPYTSRDEHPFSQYIVFSAVGFFVSEVPKIAQQALPPFRAYRVIQKLETAADKIASSFDHLSRKHEREARSWQADMHYLARDVEKRMLPDQR